MGAPPFEWIAGHSALDFHNTVSWGRSSRTEERLRSYADLLAWGRTAGLVAGPQALLARARKRPPEATQALRRALGLREVLHAVLTAIADGGAPAPGDLRSLNRSLSDALCRLEVARRPRGYCWSWTGTDALDGVLWPIAWSAARLLTSDDSARVRRCANEECGWLFVDRSRRRNRRWCAMSQCGSRAKARRYYARQRARRGRPGARSPGA